MSESADFSEILKTLSSGNDLSPQEASYSMEEIMHGKVSDARIASFLTAMKIKGATTTEIAEFAKIMRSESLKVHFSDATLTDTCGTGGDGNGTFNVSTCAAFIAAGSGVLVAKHGNRKASSQSGSADVLESLGVAMATTVQQAEFELKNAGITFLFAPAFHPAMKAVANARKELGFRTVFNILGPLCNPAGARRQIIGVSDPQLIDTIAGALSILGTQKAMVVCSDTDEISTSAKTQVAEVNSTKITKYVISPEEFGFSKSKLLQLAARDAQESSAIILSVLAGNDGPARDIAVFNAAAAIYVSGKASSIKVALPLAEKSVTSGRAAEKLEILKKLKVGK